jgi:hypothetical protein
MVTILVDIHNIKRFFFDLFTIFLEKLSFKAVYVICPTLQ